MRVLLIDDDPGATENLVLYLERDSHLVEVLHYVENRDHLAKSFERFQPDGVVLDYDMVPKGPALYQWIRQIKEGVAIVFYTKYANSALPLENMIQACASREQIIAKEETADDVPRLLRALRRG